MERWRQKCHPQYDRSQTVHDGAKKKHTPQNNNPFFVHKYTDETHYRADSGKDVTNCPGPSLLWNHHKDKIGKWLSRYDIMYHR
uniref:Uncharacterized protein n=1 Tax=Parascaris equorum TaxID=6256 RepID=A0A914R352_PAREQ